MLVTKKEGETWIEHPQKGWRKVVPSPRPMRIVNARSIDTLLRSRQVVIACGGGGMPVIEGGNENMQGIEAVIHKDLASECLATDIRAHILMILTDVPGVCLNFAMPEEEVIGRIQVNFMRQLFEKKIFPAGSMGSKVEAAVQFIEKEGEKAIIASLEEAEEALKGKTGTMIVRE